MTKKTVFNKPNPTKKEEVLYIESAENLSKNLLKDTAKLAESRIQEIDFKAQALKEQIAQNPDDEILEMRLRLFTIKVMFVQFQAKHQIL